MEFLTMKQLAERGRADEALGPNGHTQERNLVFYDKKWNVIRLNDAHDMKWGSKVDLTKPGAYEIDLDDVTSAAGLLDWFFHLNEKIWFNAQMCRDLLTVLERIGLRRLAFKDDSEEE